MRVRAGDRQRTLTSSQTYSNGAIHTLKIDLEGSAPRIVLRVGREVVKKRLQTVPVASLSTYSELLVGGAGVGVREREEISQSNFTGCISAYSLSSLLRAPKCFEREASNCSFCSSHEVVLKLKYVGHICHMLFSPNSNVKSVYKEAVLGKPISTRQDKITSVLITASAF